MMGTRKTQVFADFFQLKKIRENPPHPCHPRSHQPKTKYPPSVSTADK